MQTIGRSHRQSSSQPETMSPALDVGAVVADKEPGAVWLADRTAHSPRLWGLRWRQGRQRDCTAVGGAVGCTVGIPVFTWDIAGTEDGLAV